MTTPGKPAAVLLLIVLLASGVAAQDASPAQADDKTCVGAGDQAETGRVVLDLKRYMPLKEIRPGMKGVVHTVFSGRKIEQFEVEVLGVLGGAGPRQSAIIVRCMGERIERTGVAAGMSGSPMYIDGRMVGALAFTWVFAREPIAGIRPIEDMLLVDERAEGADDERRVIETRAEHLKVHNKSRKHFSAAARGAGVGNDSAGVAGAGGATANAGGGFADRGSEINELLNSGSMVMKPIATPLMVAGAVSPKIIQRLQKFAAQHNMVVVQGVPASGRMIAADGVVAAGGGAIADGAADDNDKDDRAPAPAAAAAAPDPAVAASEVMPGSDGKPTFAPGDPIGVLLMDGDLMLGASGTVTDVNGDRIWAFGHGFSEGGNFCLPVTTAEVITVVGLLSNSFKLCNLGPVVGTMRRDEATAIFARAGMMPENLAEISIEVFDPGAASPRKYNYRASDHYAFAHELSAVAALGSLIANNALPREHTVRYRFDISFRNHKRPLIVSGASGGGYGDYEMAYDLYYSLAPLVQNEYADLKIAAIKGRIEVVDRDSSVNIIAASTNRKQFRPGEEVAISLTLKKPDETPLHSKISYIIPADLPDGDYLLNICDSDYHVMSTLSEQPHLARIRNIDDLVRYVQLRAAPDAFYLRLSTNDSGLAVEGEALADLPASMRNVIAASSDPTDVYAHQPARVTVVKCDNLPSGSVSINLTVSRSARPAIRSVVPAGGGGAGGGGDDGAAVVEAIDSKP